MKKLQHSFWESLQNYFKLGLSGSNFFILTFIVFIVFFRLFLSDLNPLISYGLILLILCRQFVFLYFDNVKFKQKPPSLSYLISTNYIFLIMKFYIFSLILICPFFYFKKYPNYLNLYGFYLMAMAPAAIAHLISKNKFFSAFNVFSLTFFILQNLSAYFSYLTVMALMMTGCQTILYYMSFLLSPQYHFIFSIGLGSYLILVSAYLLSHLFYFLKENVSFISTPSEKDQLFFLKKCISENRYDDIHDFFKIKDLYEKSEPLMDFYLKFLFHIQDTEKITSFSCTWIAHLFQESNIKKAMSVYESVYNQHKYFNMSDPMINYTLAKNFLLIKKFDIVIELLKNISEKSPNFRHLPDVYLLLAKSYTALNLERLAYKYLNLLTQQFPTSVCYPKAVILKKILTSTSTDLKKPMS